MELNCEEKKKCAELEMLVKEWFARKKKNSMDLEKYREKCDKEWFDRKVVCYVLREDVFELIDSDIWKLFFIMDDICLSSAVSVQNALKRLIDSMENQLCLNSSKWDKHGKACRVIEEMLDKCEDRYESHDSSSQQVYAQILDYMMKLIELCDDEKTIGRVLWVLTYFPFNKYQSELLKLIDSNGNQLNTDKCGWQSNVCGIIESVLRNTKVLNQQTRDRLFDYLKKLIDCCEDDKTIMRAWSAFIKFPVKQIASQVYQPLIQNYLPSSQLNLRMHRNWILLLIRWDRCFEIIKDNIKLMWFEYLRNVLHKCDHMRLFSLAIELVEVLCLREYFDEKSEDVLKSELMVRVQSFDSECPLAYSLPDEFDFDRYQVEWSARWFVPNLMDRDKRKEMGGELPLIKLSNDRFEARYDHTESFHDPIPIRSQYSVTSGVYFYEIRVATSGKMMFGWSTYDAVFDKLNNARSQKLICQADGDYIFVHLPNCYAGDVIGCLMDTDKRRFVFYCNGKEVMGDDEKLAEVNDQKQVIFSSSPYYATSIIFIKNHCYFNFGQASFKFPPNHIQFMDFHKASGKDERKYRLAETCKIVVNFHSNFWLKHLPVDNQVDLFYRDKRQNECDELVKRVERDIEEGREVEEIEDEFGCARYIQAVIEEMGDTTQKEKIDLMAQWIGMVIKATIEYKNIKYKKKNIHTKLVQLLYPYLHLQINSTFDYIKHRNICIVLSNLIKFSERYDYRFIKYIRNEVFTYLTRTLTETSDEWTQLFGLIALDHFKLEKGELKMIQENTRIMTLLDNYTDTSKYSNILKMIPLEHCLLLSCQLHFMGERLLNLYSILRNSFATKPNTSQMEKHKEKKTFWEKLFQFITAEKRTKVRPSALNIEYQSQYLKVSHDLLTIRSDWRWQSVRYEFSGKNRIDYFEVLLLTNGPMRIGWSTKLTDFWNGAKLGADEFSICFNGHSRVMYYQNSPSPTHSIPQWKAGDVVRCLMHISTGRFYFFLNGHPLLLPDKLYFSPYPYYPSLSLSAHQQVFCNFGQCHFKYPQPNIEHVELALSIQKSLQLSGQHNSPIDLSNSSFINTILAIKATNTLGNVTLSHQSPSIPIKPKPNFAESSPFNTRQTFPKQISTKYDSCSCTPESQPVASTSKLAHEKDAQPQIVRQNEENNRLKLRVVELENQVETVKAQKCDTLTIVHAECCDYLKFCTKCGSAMSSCFGAKCNRK